MTPAVLLWAVIGVGCLIIFTTLAWISTFNPEYWVRRQAKFYRHSYKAVLKVPDDEIDKRTPRVWLLFLIDSMSHFVTRGPEHPEEFPRLLTYYRIIGIFVWFIILLTLGVLIWGIFSGRLELAY
jgi:hypothetical protein